MMYRIDLLGVGMNAVISSIALQGRQAQIIERAKSMFRQRMHDATVRAVRVSAEDGSVVFRWKGSE